MKSMRSLIRNLVLGLMLAVFAVAVWLSPIAPLSMRPFGVYGQVTCGGVTFTFVNGTIADATQVNTNFTNLVSCINASSGATLPQTTSYASLKALVGGVFPFVQREGYLTAGDGGQAAYFWSPSAACTDDGGSCIAPNVGTGRWLISPTSSSNNIKVWGAKCDGVTNDTTAFANAIAFGGSLSLPLSASNCFITGNSLTATVPFKLIGLSNESSIITITTANCTGITVPAGTVQGVVIRDLKFINSVACTSGNFLAFTGGGGTAAYAVIENVHMSNPFVGVFVDTSAVQISKIFVGGATATTGKGIYYHSGVEHTISDSILNGTASNAEAGIFIDNIGDLSITNLHMIGWTYAMELAPGAGQVVASINVVNTYFDSSVTHGLYIHPTSNTGSVVRSNFNNDWFGNSGTNGALLDNTAGGNLDGITFTAPTVVTNSGSGIVWQNGTGYVSVIGGTFAQNTTNAITVGANQTTGWAITGIKAGPTDGLAANGNGISVGTGNNNYSIVGNNLCANTTLNLNNGSSTALVQNVSNNNCVEPWTAFTPSLSCQVGALTASSATGNFKQEGKKIFFNSVLTLTTVNTCATALLSTVPVAAAAPTSFAAREHAVTGNSMSSEVGTASTQLVITKYDGTFSPTNGWTIYLSGMYQAN